MGKITVRPQRLIQHNGQLYDTSTTITDEEDSLKQALESGAAIKVEAKKATPKDKEK